MYGCTMKKLSEGIHTPPCRDALGEQASAHHGDQRGQKVSGRGARRHSHGVLRCAKREGH